MREQGTREWWQRQSHLQLLGLGVGFTGDWGCAGAAAGIYGRLPVTAWRETGRQGLVTTAYLPSPSLKAMKR